MTLQDEINEAEFIRECKNRIVMNTDKAKEYLQNKYPMLRGENWNTDEHISDNWVAEEMESYHRKRLKELRDEVDKLENPQEGIFYSKETFIELIDKMISDGRN